MRAFVVSTLTLLCFAAGGYPVACQAAPADSVDLKGSWKLVVLAFGDNEFCIFDAQTENGQSKLTIKNAQQQLFQGASVNKTEVKGGSVTIEIQSAMGSSTFKGTAVDKGPDNGRIIGSFMFQGRLFPARLEKTEAKTVNPLTVSPAVQEAMQAQQQIRDPAALVKKLKEMLAANPHLGTNYRTYSFLVKAAVSAGLPEAEVRKMVETWLGEVKPYGSDWYREMEFDAVQSLVSKKEYAPQALELAQDLDKNAGDDATTDQRAAIVNILAKAARLAGKTDIATEADNRASKLEDQLDKEYVKKVPPFEPEKFAARTNPHENRVMLVELFTGAQCPPCVAADVGFDALGESFKPSEVILLQYHLHIPGPDALTNKSTEERQSYYGVRSTPSTFFNGAADAQGGGPMQLSMAKYQQYRQIIDPELKREKRAAIKLDVKRDGDSIKILADAQADSPAQDGDAKKDDAKKEANGKLRLRLVLAEEVIRYVGGNKLRFHHHVVRAMPGGAEGQELKNGQGHVEQTVKLDDLRKSLNAYLDDFEKNQSEFPQPRPPIDFKDLVVVALVQDDGDKTVLHAVEVPVDGQK